MTPESPEMKVAGAICLTGRMVLVVPVPIVTGFAADPVVAAGRAGIGSADEAGVGEFAAVNSASVLLATSPSGEFEVASPAG